MRPLIYAVGPGDGLRDRRYDWIDELAGLNEQFGPLDDQADVIGLALTLDDRAMAVIIDVLDVVRARLAQRAVLDNPARRRCRCCTRSALASDTA